MTTGQTAMLFVFILCLALGIGGVWVASSLVPLLLSKALWVAALNFFTSWGFLKTLIGVAWGIVIFIFILRTM